MLITHSGLVNLVEANVITDVPVEHINAASIDVRLGRYVWIEHPRGGRVDLARKQSPNMIRHDLLHEPYPLRPGEFVLAQTREVFNLPDDVAIEFRLKSSAARAGLDNALATWGDPGWHGSVLTLELRNNLQHHELILSNDLKVGQIIFWRGESVPDHASYRTRGQYCGDREAQPSKGIR